MHASSTCDTKSAKAGKLKGEKRDANERSEPVGTAGLRGEEAGAAPASHWEHLGFSALIMFETPVIS